MEQTKREFRNMADIGKVVEVDASGAALTPSVVARIEEMLTPLRKAGFTHVDLLVRKVSIQHLGKDGEAKDAEAMSEAIGSGSGSEERGPTTG